MKKFSLLFCLILLFLSIFAFVTYGANAPIPIDKAYKAISQNNGKDAFIIGSFPLLHTKNREIVPQEIRDSCQDLGNSCSYTVRFQMINTENNKEYTIDLKPITGSTVYRDTKRLEKNTADPYWVLQVPPGNYEISKFIVKITLVKAGYENFSETIIDVPVSKFINQNINYNVAAHQIVYIGDFDTVLETYICLYGESQLYGNGRLNINLKNDFDNVKNIFINGADEKSKEKISAWEFISAF